MEHLKSLLVGMLALSTLAALFFGFLYLLVENPKVIAFPVIMILSYNFGSFIRSK